VSSALTQQYDDVSISNVILRSQLSHFTPKNQFLYALLVTPQEQKPEVLWHEVRQNTFFPSQDNFSILSLCYRHL